MTTAYDQFDLDIYIAKILTRKDASTQSVISCLGVADPNETGIWTNNDRISPNHIMLAKFQL